MSVYYEGGGATVLHGDCLDMMRELPDDSVHAVVTDPPYGIAFMGKAWDQPGEFGSTRKAGTAGVHRRGRDRTDEQIGDTGAMEAGRYDLSPAALVNFQRWCEQWARECLRVLKPGGHLLAFGGSRTWHRLASGIEDAGFEMRDSIAWLYGSGFSKAGLLGNKAGIEWCACQEKPVLRGRAACPSCGGLDPAFKGSSTGLKPAFEPIVLARKPLAGSTVAANVLTHGTGALNIDATRIGNEVLAPVTRGVSLIGTFEGADGNVTPERVGRWPANVVLDESQAAALDEQSGTTTSKSGGLSTKALGVMNDDSWVARNVPRTGHDDSGGASRFFPTFRYEAKAATAERPSVDGVQHPTVKPLDLMRWLVRLVTPPGGTVLEPFAGSGTTVEACLREGFSCIAIEREADYLPLIRSRIEKDHQQSLFGDWEGGAA